MSPKRGRSEEQSHTECEACALADLVADVHASLRFVRMTLPHLILRAAGERPGAIILNTLGRGIPTSVWAEIQHKQHLIRELLEEHSYGFDTARLVDNSLSLPMFPGAATGLIRQRDVEAWVQGRVEYGPRFSRDVEAWMDRRAEVWPRRMPRMRLHPVMRRMQSFLDSIGVAHLDDQQLRLLHEVSLIVQRSLPAKTRLSRTGLAKRMITHIRQNAAGPQQPALQSSSLARFAESFVFPSNHADLSVAEASIYAATLCHAKYSRHEPMVALQEWLVRNMDLDEGLLAAICDPLPNDVHSSGREVVAFAELSHDRVERSDLSFSVLCKNALSCQVMADSPHNLVWCSEGSQLLGFSITRPRSRAPKYVLQPSSSENASYDIGCAILRHRIVCSFGSMISSWELPRLIDDASVETQKVPPHASANLGFEASCLRDLGAWQLLMGTEQEGANGRLHPAFRVYDLEHQAVAGVLVGHMASANLPERQLLAVQERLVVTSDHARGVKLWDLRTCVPAVSICGTKLHTALGFKVGGLTFLAMGGDDAALTIWDVRGGSGNLAASKALYQLSTGNTSVRQLAFHTDSQSLIAAIYNTRGSMRGNGGTCGAGEDDENDEASEFSNVEGGGEDLQDASTRSFRRLLPQRSPIHKRGFSLGSCQKSLLRYVFAGGTCAVEEQ